MNFTNTQHLYLFTSEISESCDDVTLQLILILTPSNKCMTPIWVGKSQMIKTKCENLIVDIVITSSLKTLQNQKYFGLNTEKTV